MNIWIFNHYAEAPPSGQATRTFEISQELVTRGHQVTVFAADFSHHSMEYRPGGLLHDVVEDVNFFWVPTPAYNSTGVRRIFNMMAYVDGARDLASQWSPPPDVIIGVTVHPWAARAALSVARKYKVPFVLEVTDIWPDTLVDLGRLGRHSPLTWYLGRMERGLAKAASAILSYWPSTETHYMAMGVHPSKVHWVGHCVDLERYMVHSAAPEPGTVAYVGSLTHEYDIDTALNAARLIPGVRFTFYGDGEERARLEARARTEEIRNVVFPRPIPKANVPRAQQQASLLLFIRRKSPIIERFGMSNNKLAEYFAAGRPIISACRALNNPVEEARAGLSVAPGDPEALAEGIRTLFSMPEGERRAMGDNGRAFAAQHYDVRAVARKTEQILLRSCERG